MAKGGREKDQARIERRHRSLLHDRQEQEDDAGEARDDEVRSEGTQARDLQGNETEIGRTAGSHRDPFCLADRKASPRRFCLVAPITRARRAGAGRSPEGGDAALLGLLQPRLQVGDELLGGDVGARPGAALRASPPAWPDTGSTPGAGDVRLGCMRDLVVVVQPAARDAHLGQAAGGDTSLFRRSSSARLAWRRLRANWP